jgi:transcriptional regulator with XRE-family HTH domain
MNRTHSRLASFVAKRIKDLAGVRSQREIARIAGFTQPNMISMIKTGEAKLPLERVEKLAIALDCDPHRLAQVALEQFYGPEVLRLLRSDLSEPTDRARATEETNVLMAEITLIKASQEVAEAVTLARRASGRAERAGEHVDTARRILRSVNLGSPKPSPEAT